jgi:Zn-dependent protease with chaperone function
MTPSYIARLLVLSSASFFLVQLLLSALVAWIVPAAVRRASATSRPRRAAQFLFALRILPTVVSTFAVVVLCVPSYLRFEPKVAEEEVGVACLIAALLGASFLAASVYRTAAAILRTSRYLRRCGGTASQLAGETVWIVRKDAGLALAGILHPRLLISEKALRELSAEQLAVALRHESAHRASRDNLKRLLIFLAPGMFPRLRSLEQAWIKCAEWAADDCAAQGDPDRATALASALVCVARLQSGIGMPPLMTSLVEAGEDLSLRVHRLLQSSPMTDRSLHLEALAILASVSTLIAIAIKPTSLLAVHHLLERFID